MKIYNRIDRIIDKIGFVKNIGLHLKYVKFRRATQRDQDNDPS